MDPDLKAKLDKALETRKRTDSAEAKAAAERRATREANVAEFSRLLDSVIFPAMKAIKVQFEGSSIKADLRRGTKPGHSYEGIDSPNLTFVLLGEPHLTIECDASAGYVRFPYNTVHKGRGMTSGYGEVRMSDLTVEDVQSRAIAFVDLILNTK